MKRPKLTRTLLIATAISAIFVMSSHFVAQNVSESELRYREAVRKQQVDGDLPAAMNLYQDIIASKTADRATKAKALLQLAGCYETLGKESETVYQQIVRDFGDQPAATQARSKIAARRGSAASTPMAMRKMEFGAGIDNIVGTDGQKAVYWNSGYTTLFFGDIKGKEKRTVYQAKGRAPNVFVSPDLSTAFLYFPSNRGYAIVKTDGTGYRDFSLIENGVTIPATSPGCVSWSWDNKYLLMCKPRVDQIDHLLKISVADGQIQDMLGNRTRGVTAAQFSPDGKFIAYSENSAAIGLGPFGEVQIIPAQGGEPRLVSATAGLGDWTRDGQYLLVSEQTVPPSSTIGLNLLASGLAGFVAVPIRDGKPGAERLPINVTGTGLLEMHTNGVLTVAARAGTAPASSVFLGALDSNERITEWKSLGLFDLGLGSDWSPDGHEIVYAAFGLNSSGVRVRNLTSGTDREIYRTSDSIVLNCMWARKQPKLFCTFATPLSSSTEIRSIALDSNRVEKIAAFQGLRYIRRISSDDTRLVMSNFTQTANSSRTYEWEIGTDPSTEKQTPLFLSPDGRWVFINPQVDGRWQIRIREAASPTAESEFLVQTKIGPTPGGGPRAIGPLPLRFMPDSKWIVFPDKDDAGKLGLYRVSVTGGAPERLGDYPASRISSMLEVSPDGRQFLLLVQEAPKPPEFWMIENVVPSSPKTVTKR
jgi:Tol biopolymer transport system component